MDAPAFGNIEKTLKHEPVQEGKKPEADTKPVKKRKKWPFVVGGLGLLVIIALLIVTLPTLLGFKKVDVPDVADEMEADAIEILEEAGFKIKESLEELSDEVDAGKVIKTNPDAGKLREIGTEITLYVSIGKEKIEIDDYTDHDYDRVESLLESQYQSIESIEKYSDKPAGTILEQNPKAGSEIIPSETDLVFTVSKGKELLKLESLIGFDEAEFIEYGRKTGIDITVIKQDHSQTIEEGRVISQTPLPGAEVERGSKVQVVLSKGEPKKAVKSITKSVEIKYAVDEPEPPVNEEGEEVEGEGEGEAENENENQNQNEADKKPERYPQTIRIYVMDRNNTLEKPIAEFTITEDTVRKITLELEEGQRGLYRVTRDSETDYRRNGKL